MEEALTPVFIQLCVAGYILLIAICIWLFNYFLKAFKEQISGINTMCLTLKDDINNIKINMAKIEQGMIHVIKNDKSAVEALLQFTSQFNLKNK